MLAALAFELYLKCLLCLRGKSIPRKAGHHTKELFDELVQTDRDWIYPGYVSGTDTVLEALDYLFVNTRYRYEMKAPGAKKRPPLNTSKLGQLIHAARKILVRENPDWPERVARGHPKN